MKAADLLAVREEIGMWLGRYSAEADSWAEINAEEQEGIPMSSSVCQAHDDEMVRIADGLYFANRRAFHLGVL